MLKVSPEDYARLLIDSVSAILVGLDPSGRVVFFNRGAEVITGYRTEQVVGQDWFSLLVPRDRFPEVWESFQRVQRKGVIIEYYENPILTASGEERIILWRNVLAGPEMLGGATLSLGLDITAMRQAEARALASEAQFRQLIETAPDAIGAVRDGAYVYVNPALVRLLGYERREDLVGRPLVDLLHPDDRAQMLQRAPIILEQGGPLSPTLEYRLICRDGSLVTLEVITIRVQLDGQPTLLGWGRDVTERRRIEAALARAGRMASLGVLAAGIAHELNNPLTYLSLNLEMIERLLPRARQQPEAAPEQVPDTLAEIERRVSEVRDAAERVSAIVRNLRAFSRSDEPVTRPVDLRSAVQAALKMVDNELRHRGRLEISLEDPPPVQADEGRLVQVVLNLVTNALQALPEEDPASQWIRIRAAAEEGGAALTVSDSGPGIPPELADHIFDEFFTTKPPDQGTGLGLPIAAGIVRSFGGTISVGREPGGGAAFRVWLPAGGGARADEAPAAPAAAAVPAPRSLQILVVDDEPLIGSAVRAVLSPPHTVDVLVRAEDALPAVMSGRYQVVLCDLMMPGMSGMELHEQVQAQRPELARRFLFMSGGTFTDQASRFAARNAPRLIEKPFDLERLQQLIERLADEADQPPAATSDRKR